jgi:uncharacterized membrane protein YkvA (DUF1232 family)
MPCFDTLWFAASIGRRHDPLACRHQHAHDSDYVEPAHQAARDPRVPWYVKAAAGAVAAYALSPIDLIPDFIPVLGDLDEVFLLPVAIALVIRMIPAPLLMELRAEAQRRAKRPVSRAGAAFIVALWMLAAALLLWAFWPTSSS